ncbi:MAG: hypothetical protein KGJ93_02565 [Patescibacteria group bacterium]|nr:hypothetical protein [Patescibacteria group bacterium]
MDFQVVAYASGGGISLQTSGLISVAVTGVPASNLGLNLNVAFTDNKGQYNEGDAVNIKVTSTSIDAGQKATAQGIQQIYFAVYVNDSNKAVAGYTYSGSTIQFFAGPQQYNNLQVSAANGFISGSNKIIVKLYQAGTSNEVAEGYAILQAQGSGLPTANTQTPPPSGSTPPVGGTTAVGGGTANPAANIDCTKNPDPNYCLYNPLPVDSLTSTVLLIMRGFLAIVGLWCVLFIVIGGFRFVMSQGNEEAVTAARKTITWAVIGFVICLLSFSIMAIVQYVLQVNVKNVSSATSMAPIVRIIKDL